ncbi:MAG: hypothetical protein M0017_02550 [Desulfobacteraceae bacterium]|nr:hypothetical protein [Desulfobacteraceae bacterium]
MRKKVLATVMALGISMGVGLIAAQARPSKRFDAATKTCRLLTFKNLEDGYHLFENSCKSCHHRGNAQGAEFLYSESTTMKGWTRVFATRYPECAKDGVWNKLSQDQLLKINDYLYAYAWDASDPHCFV